MGVFVLGMHRSGTSAVTRVVNLLGVPIGRPERLMLARDDNPAGFWEHAGLMEVNDAVLARLGGSWDAPPADVADVDLAALAQRARDEFDATYDGDHFVYKDPRVGLLLPFWRAVLGARATAAIVVLRNPLDIAASLLHRNQLAVSYSLALWEHYLHAVLHDIAGMAVLVVDYDALVDEPTATTARLRSFLEPRGELTSAADDTAIGAFLAGGMRHSHSDRTRLDRDGRVTDEQRSLHDATVALVGAHDVFASPALGPASPSTPVLIAARRAPSTPELATLDAMTRALGVAEAQYDDCAHEAADMRPTFTAVEQTLGYRAIGRLERAALGLAGRARRTQRRLARR
jgi:sulfotransferase family protein